MNLEPFDFLPDETEDDAVKDEKMIETIRQRVVEFLDQQPDLLFSYMYRLDVEEWRIKKALKESPLTPDETLARLIWERQKQRLATRAEYKKKKTANH